VQDTVNVFYKEITDTLVLEFKNLTSNKTDTLRLLLPRVPSKRTLIRYNVLFPQTVPSADQKIMIQFAPWMDTLVKRMERIELTSTDDTLLKKKQLSGSWVSTREFALRAPLKEGKQYQLKIDTGAFMSINGFMTDSSRITSKTKSKEEFGHLVLKVKLNRKQPYLIQLLDEQNKVIAERTANFSLSSSNVATLDFPMLPPGNYKARIVYDDNSNGKWDTGELLKKKQPEKVSISTKSLKIMADWEIEEEIEEKATN
jgi:hypothetical protein